MLKKYIILLLMIFVSFSLVGCDAPSERTTNYLEKYDDFLRYSLGDYVIISESTEEKYTIMSSEPITYTVWTLQYTRYDGEVRNFGFDNLNNRNDDDMCNSVIWAAGSIWIERIKQEVIIDYFAPETMDPFVRFAREWDDLPTTLTRVEIIPQFQRYSNSKKLTDILNPESGLQLRSITLSELFTNWGIAFNVSLSTLDDENYSEILEQFKSMIRALSEYTGHDRVMVDYMASDENGIISGASFLGYYDKQIDDFNLKYR